MKMLKSTLAVVTAAAVLGVSGFAQAGATLDAVQKKGFVQCGVSDGLPGFSVPDSTGKIVGIDADYCRAVAAAVFGDATKVKFSQLNAKERFTALQSGEIDILSRNTTMTSSRDAGMGLKFPGFITYYDGIGFLVNNKLGVKSAKELDGATICIQAGTTTELNVSDYFRGNNLKYTPITFDTSDESAKSLESGRCDVLTSDKSQLFAQRSKLASPKDYVVLPETISRSHWARSCVTATTSGWPSCAGLATPCSTLKKQVSLRRTSKLKPNPPRTRTLPVCWVPTVNTAKT